MVLLLVVLVGMVAFATDTGRMYLLRAQVQNAVDSGALAANLVLKDDHEAIDNAAAAARFYVQANRVGVLTEIPDDAIDVEVGTWDSDQKLFTATNVEPNAVRVFARQDREPLFFANIFGHKNFGAPASAIASGAGSELDIMMVLDLSGSMRYQGRIQALRNSAPRFVDVIEEFDGEDLIGVMGLSANPRTWPPRSRRRVYPPAYQSGLHPTSDHHVGVLESRLTDNFDALRNVALSTGNLKPAKYDGWTGTGASIGDAAHYLHHGAESREDAVKVIVLMSDGYANRPSSNGPGYARSMAHYAKGLDIKIYTISLGNGADLDLMRDIASITGGTHFDATGSGEAQLTERLTRAFEQAAADIKRTQLVQ
jgi:hypothetical protein